MAKLFFFLISAQAPYLCCMANEYFYTKDQTERVLAAWGVSGAVPRKGEQVVVSFPVPTILNLAVITFSDRLCTYGKRLYRMVLSANKPGILPT